MILFAVPFAFSPPPWGAGRGLHPLCHQYGLSESTELVVYFLQFIVLVALCHNAATSLEPQFVVAANEGSYGYGLVKTAVKADETYATTVCTAVVWLIFRDKLHGTYLWCTAERTGREGINERLYRVSTLVEFTAHTTYEVYDVRVELHILVEIHVYVVAVT